MNDETVSVPRALVDALHVARQGWADAGGSASIGILTAGGALADAADAVAAAAGLQEEGRPEPVTLTPTEGRLLAVLGDFTISSEEALARARAIIAEAEAGTGEPRPEPEFDLPRDDIVRQLEAIGALTDDGRIVSPAAPPVPEKEPEKVRPRWICSQVDIRCTAEHPHPSSFGCGLKVWGCKAIEGRRCVPGESKKPGHLGCRWVDAPTATPGAKCARCDGRGVEPSPTGMAQIGAPSCLACNGTGRA